VRKGFVGALQEASALGCETLQIFSMSPRQWRTRVYTEEEFRDFRREREKRGIYPVIVHSPYLPNLCTADRALYERSLRALKEDLLRCENLSAEFLVIHPGAFSPEDNREVGVDRLISALNEALAAVPGRVRILVENMAGGGRRVGSRFEEIARILNHARPRHRMGICFDTCHALGAGYDLGRPEGVDRVLAEFDREIGLGEINVFHVNDSKAPLGSHRDLHQHLGQGHIGLANFQRLFQGARFQRCAFILETPKDAPAADAENLARLRACLCGEKSAVH
jgi:deoxyribonuclease-4